jgi:putative transposase
MNQNPFRYFKTSAEIIQLAVMMYVRFPLSLRNVEDLLHERGIDVCHESVRLWVDRFGPIFAGKIRTKRASFMRQHTQWYCQRKVSLNRPALGTVRLKLVEAALPRY